VSRDYIVCVDDEQAVLNQLSGQLTRRFGATHRVECAESAEEALALVPELTNAGDEVQLVICDQVMPGMKGDRFLEIVSRQWPETMKILLTGRPASTPRSTRSTTRGSTSTSRSRGRRKT
jgi:two-component system chemotaxis response regulator CheY